MAQDPRPPLSGNWLRLAVAAAALIIIAVVAYIGSMLLFGQTLSIASLLGRDSGGGPTGGVEAVSTEPVAAQTHQVVATFTPPPQYTPTPAPSPNPTDTPTPAYPEALVLTETLNLRAGPGYRLRHCRPSPGRAAVPHLGPQRGRQLAQDLLPGRSQPRKLDQRRLRPEQPPRFEPACRPGPANAVADRHHRRAQSRRGRSQPASPGRIWLARQHQSTHGSAPWRSHAQCCVRSSSASTTTSPPVPSSVSARPM